MFGVLIIDDGKDCYNSFKVFDNLTKAQDYATNAVCGTGLKATIYDYDVESEMFIEFYDVG